MPNFLVVRCCNCNIFQVQQENKKRKFSCKICNYKQSVLRIYLESTNPANCRAHVQVCNTKIIPLLEEKKKLKSILNHGDYDERYNQAKNRTIDSYFKRDKTSNSQNTNDNIFEDGEKKDSHWNMYLSESENEDDNENENGINKINTFQNKNNNLDNEKEEELARNLIEKIAASILKNDDNDTESSQEENSWSDEEQENRTVENNQNVIEINNNSALTNYYNSKGYNINDTDIQNYQKSQIYIRNRKRNIVYDKNDILDRSQGERDLSKYQNKFTKRLKYSNNNYNNNRNYETESSNKNNGFISASSVRNINNNSNNITAITNENNSNHSRNINQADCLNLFTNYEKPEQRQKNSLFNLSSLK